MTSQIVMDGQFVAAPASARPDVWGAVKRGLRRQCPCCGAAPLFSGYLTVRPVCPVCANPNGTYPSDDFAPYVTIFLVLHLMVPVLLLIDHGWNPSVWLEGVVALPIFTVATLGLLPFAKGGVVGLAYALGVTRREPEAV